MIRKVLLFAGSLVGLLVIVVIYFTFTAKPWPIYRAEALIPLPAAAVANMSKAIQIKTVTPEDTIHLDTVQFNAFRNFLETSYPLVHQHLTRTLINGYNYIFEWKGTDTSLAPMILMGHYDVVPVEASANKLWTALPFGGEVKNNSIWGRGAVDDKLNVISILESAEQLLRKGYTPKQTILFCFGCNEESTGTGAQAIVRYLQSKNIHAKMVLDEGGEITREKVKTVSRPVALIGVAEKGYMTLELTVEKPGGHSSQPADETSIDILSKALYHLRSVKPAASVSAPLKTFLTRVSGSSNSFLQKMALNNLWLTEGMVISSMSEIPSFNAMFRTTIVPTIINSGVRENVIPTNAKAIVNCRILPGDTKKTVVDFITHAIHDERVHILIAGDYSRESSPVTDVTSDAYRKTEITINKVSDSVITTPYIMLGATDSRSFRNISDGVINFSPVTDGKGYHGIDEHITLTDLQRCISFFTLLMKE